MSSLILCQDQVCPWAWVQILPLTNNFISQVLISHWNEGVGLYGPSALQVEQSVVHQAWNQEDLRVNLAPELPSYVTLGKSFHLIASVSSSEKWG